MFSTREWIIFFAGAEVLHTISHIVLSFSGTLPLTFWGFEFTSQWNMIAIVINALIAVLLLWWASREPVTHHR